MPKRILDAGVIAREKLAEGIFGLLLEAEPIAAEAAAGQFVSLYSAQADRLLPRPISLCGIDRERGTIRLVYRVAGAGTKEFSELLPGEKVRVMGPLGNGFPLKGSRPVLIGGGIGIPPMLELAKAFGGRAAAVLGYRSERFLETEFESVSRVYTATEDGSFGTRGTVLDAIRQEKVSGDVLYACGPLPMLRAVKEYAIRENLPCYVSMEERMACGIGACLACVCRTTETDAHSNVRNRRICKDGPVFEAREVEL